MARWAFGHADNLGTPRLEIHMGMDRGAFGYAEDI